MRSQGVHVPSVILISPTMRCNLHCTGCYAASYSTKDDLELEVIDRVLSEMEELGIFWATILGGEPFIRRDMWEIYKKHDDIFFQIFTNGTLIDKEVAKILDPVWEREFADFRFTGSLLPEKFAPGESDENGR